MSFKRFFSIIKKEFIQIKRDKASFGIALVMPIMMMLLFGYAVSTELDNISMIVLDESRSTDSRQLIDSFKNTGYFNVKGSVNNLAEIYKEIDTGKAHAAVIIPADFTKDKSIQLIIDGSDPTTARTALSSGVLTSENYGINAINKVKEKMNQGNSTSSINISTRVLYNPSMRSQNFTVPGLIGLIMQNITIILTAFALVREKERGTIEQLLVSPLKPFEIIIGKLIPYIIIGFFDFLYALFFGLYYFKVPIAGSLPLLIFLGSGFVICALAIGILISTISKTQLQAMQLSVLIILPSVLLSGFMFPRESMPKAVQLLGYALPLTYFLNILRDIILKGLDISYLYKDLIPLFLLGFILLILSIVSFRRKLD
jgi:ABC-2 type transport system permease protein